MKRTQQPSKTKESLKEQRFNELKISLREQTLQSVIGPFGLTPAMFDDKTGGNVTTLHNFEKGITATNQEKAKFDELVQKSSEKKFRRSDYDKYLPAKRKKMFKQEDAPISAYTGNELTRDVQTHLDHVRAVKSIEMDSKANLFMTKEQRVEMANQDANLVPAEGRINQSMQDQDKREWSAQQRKADKGKTNAEYFELDSYVFEQTVKNSERAIERDLLVAQLKKQGSELAMTGAKEAGKNALRQALGVLLFEFVNGIFVEWPPFKEPGFIDRLIAAFKRVANRVINKLGSALDAAIQGGVQGFVSNLLTFIINSVVTTSAKVVTIIREGMKGLWEAVKMIANPPEHMSSDEVFRQVTKIIAGVVTMSLGMLFEESVNAFLVSTGMLYAGAVSQVITGLLTGIISALVIYGLDNLFDRLAEKGTDLLHAKEANLDELQSNLLHMADLLEAQFKNSAMYQDIAKTYLQIGLALETACEASTATHESCDKDWLAKEQLLEELSLKKQQYQDSQQELDALMADINIKGWGA
ncbi:hypothetical protein L5M18_13055 [Shewanella sp. SM20]|uniref:hypothetical protein n=1 Tax=Shewanella sp. SM20 TaxID=2912792 RepID=UPI0021D8A856|nr:hypothetical protein [Shewanella sp. SM20]MCU8092486.1 hypothetical protein [Shewanella sp. SM20]